jgi:hypothetical protein
MDPTRPRYNGIYGRLFISPTVVLGLGRWGVKVCNRFFDEMAASLAPAARGFAVAGGVSLKACFASLACVRDMDRGSMPLGWADVVRSWPASLDDLTDGVFTDLDNDLASVAFWRVPRRAFECHKRDLIDILVPDLRELLGRVSSNRWQAGCRALGLKEAGNLDLSRKWIVAVGNLFEPELPLVLDMLRTAVIDDVLHGEIGQCHFLYILDAGVPDAPARRDQVWANCPGSLIAQFLGGSHLIHADSDHSIVFYTTSTSALGFGTPECDRAAIAVGILKSYLNTFLLAPREQRTQRWDTLSLSAITPAATTDRTASFIEVALDLQNLRELLAHELLARWKRRLFAEQFPQTSSEVLCEWFNGWLDRSGAAEEPALEFQVLSSWFEAGLNPNQHVEIARMRSVVEEHKSMLVELLARSALPAASSNSSDNSATIPESPGPWTWLKRIFRIYTETPQETRPTTPPPFVLNEKITRCADLVAFLEKLEALLHEIDRPESIFQNRIYDEHFCYVQESPATILLSYRRIPLYEDCPAFIKQFLDVTDPLVPDTLLQTLFGCSNPEELSKVLVKQLGLLWETYPSGPTDADQRWSCLGIAQWAASDPYLADAIARFAYAKLIPLWRPYPLRETNWEGFLTVFDYGVQPSGPPSDSTLKSIDAVRRSWRAIHQQEQTHQFGIIDHPAEVAFDPANILWETWPCYAGFAILWTDYPIIGVGFRADWNVTQLHQQAKNWAEANPTDLSLIPSWADVAFCQENPSSEMKHHE